MKDIYTKNSREDWIRKFKKNKNKLLINDNLDIYKLWKNEIENRVEFYEKGKIDSVDSLVVFKKYGKRRYG